MNRPRLLRLVRLGFMISSAACSVTTQTEEGVGVGVWVAGDASGAGTNPLIMDLGYSLSLQRALIVDGWVDLRPCPATARSQSPLESARPSSRPTQRPALPLTQRMWRLVVGEAQAHPSSSPLRLAAPMVQSLVPDGPSQFMGRVFLPPDRYCFVTLTIAAADGDTMGLPPAPPLVGTSLYVEGTLLAPGTESAQAFVVSTSLPLSIETSILPLNLSGSGTRQAQITIKHDVAHWFDGIPLDSKPPRLAVAAILDNIRRSISVVVAE
jgi:hypothetical protein